MALSYVDLSMSTHSTVSHCANPKCGAEFKRLGEGVLFICPTDPEVTVNHLRQKAIWLCEACAREFEVQFQPNQHNFNEVDRPHQSY